MTEKNFCHFGHEVRKYRLVNIVTVSFNIITGQMTENCLSEKNRAQWTWAEVTDHRNIMPYKILQLFSRDGRKVCCCYQVRTERDCRPVQGDICQPETTARALVLVSVASRWRTQYVVGMQVQEAEADAAISHHPRRKSMQNNKLQMKHHSEKQKYCK